MLLLEGMPISPGHGSGIALVYDYEIERHLELPNRAISHSEVDAEFSRLNEALGRSQQDLKIVAQTALTEPRLWGDGCRDTWPVLRLGRPSRCLPDR